MLGSAEASGDLQTPAIKDLSISGEGFLQKNVLAGCNVDFAMEVDRIHRSIQIQPNIKMYAFF